jgi:outer membrane protein OmpA-like peptidoglycan-associated protein
MNINERLPRIDARQAVELMENAMSFFSSRSTKLATLAAFAVLAGCSQSAQAPAPVVTQYNPPAPAVAALKGPSVTHYQVAFASNSTLIDADGQQAITTAGDTLRGNTALMATVVGRTDTVGSDARNMRLSKQRANKVARALLKTGNIDASRVDVRWTGERQQGDQAPANTAEASDRVVDISVH